MTHGIVEYAYVSATIARELCAAHGFKMPAPDFESLVKYEGEFGWLRRTSNAERREYKRAWKWRRAYGWRLDERNRAVLGEAAARRETEGE